VKLVVGKIHSNSNKQDKPSIVGAADSANMHKSANNEATMHNGNDKRKAGGSSLALFTWRIRNDRSAI